MPLKKLIFKPGVNRENTRYTTEGGFYECDKIRFRQGTPEKIGGWNLLSSDRFKGVCRSIWNWVTLTSLNLLGLGTNLKFYIEQGTRYNDITPIRSTATLTNPFTATLGSRVITVTDTAHGCLDGDFVTFYNATGLGGNISSTVLNANHQITLVNPNTYTITVGVAADATDVLGSPGGGTVYAVYEINTGPSFAVPATGWGAGAWGSGAWGVGVTDYDALRLWSQNNFGEDLIFGPRGGGIYYWDASLTASGVGITFTIASPCVATTSVSFENGAALQFSTTAALPTGLLPGVTYYVINTLGSVFNLAATPGGTAINTTGSQSGSHIISPRGVNMADYGYSSDVPVIQNFTFISDAFRFVFCFGCNDLTSSAQDPMLIRWSDQEDAFSWTPAVTNQAGSIRLSHGSEIVTAAQARQEILVWTDSSLYSLQYLGPPYVWGSSLLGDNISIVGQNATTTASGITYWMGVDKFYRYDGRISTLRCDLRQYVFQDINKAQFEQVFAGTNEGFNEVWWFYCSANSDAVDKYVIYNYVEDIWYYGNMARTAWLDTSLRDHPVAATYLNNIVNHETGLDDNVTGIPVPIYSYIQSSEFDIDDGHNFGFIWRIVPDLTFRGSTAASPQVTMTLYPLQNSGSGYDNPASVGGTNFATVTRTATIPVEQFTGQVYTRVRGRQLAMRIESNQLGAAWQLGAPRIDIKQDGRR
jgi:hypothetical protein